MPISKKHEAELNRAHSARYREAEDQLKAHLANLVLAKNLVASQEIDGRVGVRIKPPADIVDKIDRKRPRRVKSLEDLEHRVVTDIVGGRVVLDYRDQVRTLCQDIKQCNHWRVVRDNRGRVHHDTGYRSNHIDVILHATTNHRDVRCEIQVRSLLQHAFATYSHPIYKRYRMNTSQIPDFFRGRLRQISDSLDSIDKQVEKLHNEIQKVSSTRN